MSVKVRLDLGSLSGLAGRVKDKIGQAIDESGTVIEGIAKAAAPVDTGALVNSIQYRKTGELEGEVAVGVDHGAFVELGTRRTAAQPYLIPAAEAERPHLVKRVAQAVKEAADRR